MTIRPHPARLLKLAAQGPFDYPTSLVGKTSDGLTSVYYDPSLGQPGLDLAEVLVAAGAKINSDCAAFFGIPCQPVNLIIANLGGNGSGLGGAYHYSCLFSTGGDLYVDAANGNPEMDIGLYVAELVEAFMGAAARGWNCGGSGGESLSRVLAEIESGGPNGAMAPYVSAPSWDSANRPNWIDSDQGSDQDYPSIGCGLVYLSWMLSLGFTPAQITQAGEPSGTLASNYTALTGKTTAWADMTAALVGVKIADDDPFGGIAAGGSQPAPTPPPVPPTPPSPPPPVPPSPPPPVPPAPPPPSPPAPPAPPTPPTPPAPTPAGWTKGTVIDALTALVNVSTLPD